MAFPSPRRGIPVRLPDGKFDGSTYGELVAFWFMPSWTRTGSWRRFAGRVSFGQARAAVNLPETMKALSRRSFLAASAAVAARPVLAAPAPQPDVDVVIVGAGAAGIAAARRIAPTGRRAPLPGG